ncbi:MAG: hypothetical protein AAFU73_02820 [Planctomycetota bacterium]
MKKLALLALVLLCSVAAWHVANRAQATTERGSPTPSSALSSPSLAGIDSSINGESARQPAQGVAGENVPDAGVSLLRGSIIDADSGQRLTGTLQLASATHAVDHHRDEGEASSLTFLRYTMNGDSGSVSVDALDSGVSVDVVDGSWVMECPTESLVATRFRSGSKRYDFVGSRRIAKGSQQVLFTVRARSLLLLTARSSITGEHIDDVIVHARPMVPRGRPVAVLYSGTSSSRPKAPEEPAPNGSLVRVPGSASLLVESAHSPVELDPLDAPSRVWVSARGYQTEWCDLLPGSDAAEVLMRPTGTLIVTTGSIGWPTTSLQIRVYRAGQSLATRVIESEVSSIELAGIGTGECRVDLEYRSSYAGNIEILSEVAYVPAGGTAEVTLQAPPRDVILSGRLVAEIDLGELAPAFWESYGVNFGPAPRGGASASGYFIPFANMDLDDGVARLDIELLPPGPYELRLDPPGLVASVEVPPGGIGSTTLAYPAVGVVTFDVSEHASEDELALGSHYVIWRPATSGTDGPFSESSSMETHICRGSEDWVAELPIGVADLFLFDAQEQCLSIRRGVSIETGSQSIAFEEPLAAFEELLVRVEGVDLSAREATPSSSALELTLADGSVGLRPVETSFERESDLTNTVEFRFLLDSAAGIGAAADVQFGGDPLKIHARSETTGRSGQRIRVWTCSR